MWLALQHGARRYLAGMFDVSPIQAGLNTVGFLRDGITSRQAEAAALAHGVEAIALSRFALKKTDVQALLVGFAAFDEREIHRGIVNLAAALEHRAVSSK